MLRCSVRAAWVVVMAATLPAAAQDVPRPPVPGSEIGRFTFEPLHNGLLRLDTRTGEMSHCRPRARGWSCEVVAENRAAYEREIARLSDKVQSLEGELARRAANQAETARLKSRIAKLEAELARRSASQSELSVLKSKVATLETELARRGTGERELAELKSKVAALEAERARRPTPPAVTPPTPPGPSAPLPPSAVKPPAAWPNDQEVDRAMRYLEDLFRRFLTMVDRLRREPEASRL